MKHSFRLIFILASAFLLLYFPLKVLGHGKICLLAMQKNIVFYGVQLQHTNSTATTVMMLCYME